MPVSVASERTAGLYDRQAKQTEKAKEAMKRAGVPVDEALVKQAIATPGKFPEEVKIKIKLDLDKQRKELQMAKDDLKNFMETVPTDIPAYEEKKVALEIRVTENREKFRSIEKRKNLIWFGTETPEKK